MAKPRTSEVKAVVRLLEGEADNVVELAEQVIETVLANHAKYQKWTVVAQEVDHITRQPVGDKTDKATPRGNAVAFSPVSTYKQAEDLAKQVSISSTASRAANAWAVPYFAGSTAMWWKEAGKGTAESPEGDE